MKDPVLIDTGPFVACFDPNDKNHHGCMNTMQLLKGRHLVTTLSIVTEVLFLLDFSIENQQKFLRFMASGVIEILELISEDLLEAGELMKKYHDCPMDFGDATLVVLANRLQTRQIFTLDERDFTIYRTLQGKSFERI